MTETTRIASEGQMRGLDPAAQVGVGEAEIPHTAIKNVDLAHDMALAGDSDRSSAAFARARARLSAEAIAGAKVIMDDSPSYIGLSDAEERDARNAYEERLREFYIGIGRRNEQMRRKHIGGIHNNLKPGKTEDHDDLAQTGGFLANSYYNNPEESNAEAQRGDARAERKEGIVKILHDHPELVTLDGKPMTPDEFEHALVCWDRIDEIEGAALFVEDRNNNIGEALDNMFAAIRNYGGSNKEATAAAEEVLKLASNDNTTVGELRAAAADVVRGLKVPYEAFYGSKIEPINHETSQT